MSRDGGRARFKFELMEAVKKMSGRRSLTENLIRLHNKAVTASVRFWTAGEVAMRERLRIAEQSAENAFLAEVAKTCLVKPPQPSSVNRALYDALAGMLFAFGDEASDGRTESRRTKAKEDARVALAKAREKTNA